MRSPRWQLDAEGRAASRFARHRDRPLMIADHRLHDGQAEAGAVALGGVVRREQARAFFAREALAGIGDFEPRPRRSRACRAHAQSAAVGHGVHGVQNQVAQSAPELLGIG